MKRRYSEKLRVAKISALYNVWIHEAYMHCFKSFSESGFNRLHRARFNMVCYLLMSGFVSSKDMRLIVWVMDEIDEGIQNKHFRPFEKGCDFKDFLLKSLLTFF